MSLVTKYILNSYPQCKPDIRLKLIPFQAVRKAFIPLANLLAGYNADCDPRFRESRNQYFYNENWKWNTDRGAFCKRFVFS